MTDYKAPGSIADRISQEVSAFYEHHPYPPPVDSLERYRQQWNDDRRRADAHLFWPTVPYRDDRTILVAGCGTSQAARYALRWPRAKVTGIDVSATSIEQTELLKRKHCLDNLEVIQLPVELATELGCNFDYVVCTGVLHHLSDPDKGLRALHDVLEPDGAMHVMVYAPYGRAGVYLLQDYCRRLGIGTSSQEIKDLVASLKALPPDHPLIPLLAMRRTSARRPRWPMRCSIPRTAPIRCRSYLIFLLRLASGSAAGCGKRPTCRSAVLWRQHPSNLC
jgi:SAM-dependent methyltransferase